MDVSVASHAPSGAQLYMATGLLQSSHMLLRAVLCGVPRFFCVGACKGSGGFRGGFSGVSAGGLAGFPRGFRGGFRGVSGGFRRVPGVSAGFPPDIQKICRYVQVQENYTKYTTFCTLMPHGPFPPGGFHPQPNPNIIIL